MVLEGKANGGRKGGWRRRSKYERKEKEEDRIKEGRCIRGRRGTAQALGYTKEHGRTETMYSTPQPTQERNCLLQSLGYTRNKDVLNPVLNLALYDSVMRRSGTACFSPWATPGTRTC